MDIVHAVWPQIPDFAIVSFLKILFFAVMFAVLFQ